LTTPAVAIALLVLMMAFALIIDRIWLETAKLELNNAAEAAALAAAGQLASDDLLRLDAPVEERLQNARLAAGDIAAENFVCGTAVELNTEPEGDIRIGVLELTKNGIRFVESDDNPTSVVVTALRTRSNNNPIALVIAGVTKLAFGDVATRVEASISNDLVGLRAIEGTPIPALPVAIYEVDPSGDREDTWQNLIEDRKGTDDYSFDEESNTVIDGPDGIPEMVLRSMRLGQDPAKANVLLLDLGTGVDDNKVARQFKSGLTVDDLENFDGQLVIGQGATLALTATPDFDGAQQIALQKMIGECRICFLYSQSVPQRKQPDVTATCSQIVAVRILAVSGTVNGTVDVTVQPTVMKTRTALLASESGATTTATPSDTLESELENSLAESMTNTANNPNTTNGTATTSSVNPNKYVYKLRLTY
jgi:Flp pilus assembly protein TadG